MVISQKIDEKKMGNRGSKSSICKSMLVKEQRADGSCSCAEVQGLRCALMGGESHFQVGIPSNLKLAKATYSTLSIAN
jgi:hypothetical protein